MTDKLCPETTGERIKTLRESLGINQREFCKLLALSGGYITSVETGAREANDRLIKLIGAEFNVNEEWLVRGKGQMFDTKTNDERTARLVAVFNELPQKYQDVIFGIIDLLRKT